MGARAGAPLPPACSCLRSPTERKWSPAGYALDYGQLGPRLCCEGAAAGRQMLLGRELRGIRTCPECLTSAAAAPANGVQEWQPDAIEFDWPSNPIEYSAFRACRAVSLAADLLRIACGLASLNSGSQFPPSLAPHPLQPPPARRRLPVLMFRS